MALVLMTVRRELWGLFLTAMSLLTSVGTGREQQSTGSRKVLTFGVRDWWSVRSGSLKLLERRGKGTKLRWVSRMLELDGRALSMSNRRAVWQLHCRRRCSGLMRRDVKWRGRSR
jgi:hypothetical protein